MRTFGVVSQPAEIPFPKLWLDPSVGDGVFEQGAPFRLQYDLDPDNGTEPEVMMAKPPGGKDAKRGKKEKPKGHTDTSTKRK